MGERLAGQGALQGERSSIRPIAAMGRCGCQHTSLRNQVLSQFRMRSTASALPGGTALQYCRSTAAATSFSALTGAARPLARRHCLPPPPPPLLCRRCPAALPAAVVAGAPPLQTASKSSSSCCSSSAAAATSCSLAPSCIACSAPCDRIATSTSRINAAMKGARSSSSSGSEKR